MDMERLQKQMDFIVEVDKVRPICQMQVVRKTMQNIPGIWH